MATKINIAEDYPEANATIIVDLLRFSKIDYGLFGLMLALSAAIGIYFGFFSKKKQDNTEEYLLGSKTMSTFPVSASLIASHISGIALLSVPAEIYANGSQYMVFPICILIIGLLMCYVFLPVFFDLNLSSCFTYLEIRFNRTVRCLASFVYAISCLIHVPIVMYIPALALSQVTGISVHYITPGISLICTFYTTVGGLRAVVWTDTLQFLVMAGSVITVCIIGTIEIGSFSDVWNIADRGGRVILFNMDPNPLIRTSFWTMSIGLTTMWLSNLGVSQGCVQRFLAVPSLHEARKAMLIFGLGHIGFKLFSTFTGLLMYAHYETCDPISIGAVKKLDQILPYYVMDVAGYIPGLPGLFIAGIFAAGLSSMSSSLNTLAGTIFDDFIRIRMPDVTEKTASNYMKVIVVILGFGQLFLIPVVENLGSVFHLAVSFGGVTSGTMIGMFTFGMFVKQGNTKGVIAGIICAMVGVGTILIGAQMVPKPPPLPFRTDGCSANLMNELLLNSTIIPTIIELPTETHWVFRISFMYYALIGLIIMFVVGYPVSLLTGGTNHLDEILLTPCMRSKAYKNRQKDTSAIMKEYVELNKILVDIKKQAK